MIAEHKFDRFRSPGYSSGPPVIVGGTGNAILSLAARRADIVSVGGLIQAPGQPPGTFQLHTAAEAEERTAFVRAQAGDRAADLELNVLIQAVLVTRDRRAAADQLVVERGLSLSAAEALETPFLLTGTESEIADQLAERRDRFGFSYVTVHEPYLTDLAPVIARLR